MIEYEFRREPDHNYLIPKIDWSGLDEYSIRMITENDIPGYLHVKAERMNGVTTLCYDVTSMQSIEVLFTRRAMGEKDIRAIFRGIMDALDHARNYLLSSDNIVLHPGFIYMEPEIRQIRMCYIPGYSGMEHQDERQLLAEFILRHLDHEDHEAVDLGYGFYEQISRRQAGLASVLQHLTGQRYIVDSPEEKGSDASERISEEEYPEISGEEHPAGAYSKKRFVREKSSRGVKDAGSVFAAEKERVKEEKTEEERKENRKGERKRKKKEEKKEKKEKKCSEKREKKYEKKQDLKKYLPWAAAGIVLAVLYVLIIFLFSLDLTQIGGLAFLFIAVFWLVYGTVTGKRKNINPWITEKEENQEDAFLEQLMSEMYEPEAQGEALPWQQEERAIAGMGEDKSSVLTYQHGKNQQNSSRKPDGRQSEKQQTFGQTRLLRIQEGPSVTLVSENIRYPNLKASGEECLIGKQANNVDLVLPPHDALSRIHAKLECTAEGIFITDMNSANGTRVNDVLITRRSEVHAGDRISFAGFHYVVRVE